MKQVPKVAVQRHPVAAWSNTVFIVSLALTAYFFLVEHKLSLAAGLSITSMLVLLRILAEWVAKNSSD